MVYRMERKLESFTVRSDYKATFAAVNRLSNSYPYHPKDFVEFAAASSNLGI
ncbi:MAG: hypothetical protein WA941_14395 [Nitrososphaeraceae archaeon]